MNLKSLGNKSLKDLKRLYNKNNIVIIFLGIICLINAFLWTFKTRVSIIVFLCFIILGLGFINNEVLKVLKLKSIEEEKKNGIY